MVVKNRTAFASRYGSTARIAERQGAPKASASLTVRLSNQGELLTLLDANGQIIQQFEYNDSGKWPGRADQGGSTLEVVDVHADDLQATGQLAQQHGVWRLARSARGGSN